MRLKKYTLFLSFLAGVLFVSCSKDDYPKAPEGKERTFFLYFAADNSLGNNYYDYSNIITLIQSIKASHLTGANVIIYHDPKTNYKVDNNNNGDYEDEVYYRPDAKPRLLEMVIDNAGNTITKEVRIYDEQNSGTIETFKQIMNEVLTMYPAEKYSLLMWSHGSGWLPGVPDWSTRAIGQDNRDGNSWIELDELSDAIPDGQFDYIVFDACNMAYVEVAYALRKKTDYIIASTIEIMGNGMNYDKMPDLLLAKNPNYTAFCDAFFKKYDSAFGATISLIKTAGLDELALTVKDVLKNVDVETDIINGLASTSLQRFGRSTYRYAYFDLGDFMEQLGTSEQYTAFQKALGKTMAYNLYSEGFMLNTGYESFFIRKHSGLGCYIPREYPKLNEYYETLYWYKAVYP